MITLTNSGDEWYPVDEWTCHNCFVPDEWYTQRGEQRNKYFTFAPGFSNGQPPKFCPFCGKGNE